MRTDHHLDPEEDALVKMGYELEDVDYRKLGKSIVYFFGFVAFCGVAGVIIFFLFLGGGGIPEAYQAAMNPPADSTPSIKRLPPKGTPLLQTNITARTDIAALRQEENHLLQGEPSWVDKDKGIARIPIAEAVDDFSKATSAETTIASGAPPVDAPKHEEGGASH